MVNLALLRREAELVKADFDAGEWVSRADADFRGFAQPQSNPGAVAERTIALIEECERLREWRRGIIRHAEVLQMRTPAGDAETHAFLDAVTQ